MISPKPSFSQLFRKYRLRSEFENLSDFGDALAQKQLHFENSLFSHWQKGDRMPKDRALLLIILKIFVERGGLKRLKEANEFFASAGHGYLTDEEIQNIPGLVSASAPFQPPRDIESFVGRKEIIKEAKRKILEGKPILIHGPAGIGKTALAIKLAHNLREEFPDGVLWYRLDVSNPDSILTSIAQSFGKDISQMRDVYFKASFVRSLLAEKKALIIYDNAEENSELNLLLPSSEKNSAIITSQFENLEKQYSLSLFHLSSLEEQEADELFVSILGKNYLKKYSSQLHLLSLILGYMPLATRIAALELKKSRVKIEEMIKQLDKEKIRLNELAYENTNLFASLSMAFNKLKTAEQSIFTSLSIFEGADFALEAVCSINDLSIPKGKDVLNTFIAKSLVELSSNGRYRLHPFVKIFAQKQIKHISFYRKAALFYKNYLITNFAKKTELTEHENILGIFDKCFENDLYDEILGLRNNLGHLFWNIQYWDKYENIIKKIARLSHKKKDYETEALCYIRELSWLPFWRGNFIVSEKNTTLGLIKAQNIGNKLLVSYAKERLSKIYLTRHKFDDAIRNIEEVITTFVKGNPYERLTCLYRYLGEAYACLGYYQKAEQHFKRALNYAYKVNDPMFATLDVAFAKLCLGIISIKLNLLTEAELYFSESIQLSNRLNFTFIQNITNYIGLTLVAEKNNDLTRAMCNLERVQEFIKHFNFPKVRGGHHYAKTVLSDEINSSSFYKQLHAVFEVLPL